MYDVIGDIHGHSDELIRLLKQMDYVRDGDGFRHADRTAVFVGDLIDRGPRIAETLRIVRHMVDAGAARIVMGNHEFNAIAFHTAVADSTGEPSFCRPHSAKNLRQHQATLDQLTESELVDAIDWFRTLPVALELDGIRVVHACWHAAHLELINERLSKDLLDAVAFGRSLTDCTARPGHLISGLSRDTARFCPAFLCDATNPETDLFNAIEEVLKGPELILPDGIRCADKDGHLRSRIRIRWYEATAGRTYRDYALPSSDSIPDTELPREVPGRGYATSEPPVFVGHYWLPPQPPEPLSPNVACVDYSVARGGNLCAYRWNGESRLTPDAFVCVPSNG